MQPRFIHHTEIDRHKWDACIQSSGNSLIYAFSWYLDIVSPGWHGLVSGDYDAVMPLTQRKKFAVKYLAQPAFAQQLGVFSEKVDHQITLGFLEELRKQYSFAEIHLNYLNELPGLKSRTNFVLDLNRPYDEIRKGYSSENIKNLGKSIRRGARTTKKLSVQDVISLYRSAYGEANPQLKDEHYKRFETLTNVAVQRNCAELLGVETENGQLCGGAVFMLYGGRAIYVMGAGNEEGKVLQAMHFLLDAFIQKHANSSMLLDFEGSEIPGVSHFYKKFGPVNQPYYQYRYNNLPWPMRMLKR